MTRPQAAGPSPVLKRVQLLARWMSLSEAIIFFFFLGSSLVYGAIGNGSWTVLHPAGRCQSLGLSPPDPAQYSTKCPDDHSQQPGNIACRAGSDSAIGSIDYLGREVLRNVQHAAPARARAHTHTTHTHSCAARYTSARVTNVGLEAETSSPEDCYLRH